MPTVRLVPARCVRPVDRGEVTSPASVVCAHCVPSPGPSILHMKIALIPQQPCKVF